MTTALAELCSWRWPDAPWACPYGLIHRCDKPTDHPAPCRCRCGATTTREESGR